MKKLIEKDPAMIVDHLVSGTYEELSDKFVYNFELLMHFPPQEFLKIRDSKDWTPLELAVLNFNPTAVSLILSTLVVTRFQLLF